MEKVKGCAFLCDLNGKIDNVLRDDFNFSEFTPKGKLFTSLIEKQSLELALNFITEIKNKNVAFDYRLNVNYKNEIRSLYFLGVSLENFLLLIGADNHKEAVEFTNHLHTINNEQSNLIRKLLKEKIQVKTEKEKETERLLAELTLLNNELINLQRKLNKQNKELERLNEIKNRFMGIASHDLRNPLNVIQIYSEFLMENDENNLTEEQLTFSKVINNSSRFMIGLVNDLLEFSKIESGKIELTIQQFDIVKTALGIVDLFKPIAFKKNIVINFSTNVKSLILEADLFKIEQVLNNLLGNSVKFSYLHSEIFITVELQELECLISVTNTGDGIKPEDGERLFKPFQKIAARGTGNEAGSGLGLFIVKQIIDNHKGKLWYTSTPTKETTFYVRLPIKNNA